MLTIKDYVYALEALIISFCSLVELWLMEREVSVFISK